MDRFLTDEDRAIMKATHYGLFKERKHPTDDVRRWFNDGEEIEFTGIKLNYSNAEFTINRDPNFKIWFSQLWGYSLLMEDFKIDADSLYVPYLLLKGNSSPVDIQSLDVDGFWNKVRGRRFKVTVPDDGVYVYINLKTEKLEGTPWGEILDKALDLVRKKDYKTISDLDLLHARPFYNFEEI